MKQNYILERHEDAFLITVFGADKRVTYDLATDIKFGNNIGIDVFLYNKLRKALKLFQMMSFYHEKYKIQEYIKSQMKMILQLF